jgi:hypothetical protein
MTLFSSFLLETLSIKFLISSSPLANQVKSSEVVGYDTEPYDVPGKLSNTEGFSALLVASYERFVDCPLLPSGIAEADMGRWLYEDAPFCVLAHNTDTDPRFVYANRAAQRCFEYDWSEFTSLPSRLSAEATNRGERQRLLDVVTRDGFASGYCGLRVAKSGRRFWIEDGVVWQLVGADGSQRASPPFRGFPKAQRFIAISQHAG